MGSSADAKVFFGFDLGELYELETPSEFEDDTGRYLEKILKDFKGLEVFDYGYLYGDEISYAIGCSVTRGDWSSATVLKPQTGVGNPMLVELLNFRAAFKRLCPDLEIADEPQWLLVASYG